MKAENILVTDDGASCKLTDFGFAVDYRRHRPVTRLGTLQYMAPEILVCDAETRRQMQHEGRAGYGPEVDCWAIGVLAYECLVGQTPYEEARTMEELLEYIATRAIFPEHPAPPRRGHGSFSFAHHGQLSHDAKDFIAGCLQVDPAARLTAREMLSHPFVTQREQDLQRYQHPHSTAPRMRVTRGATTTSGCVLSPHEVVNTAYLFDTAEDFTRADVESEKASSGLNTGPTTPAACTTTTGACTSPPMMMMTMTTPAATRTSPPSGSGSGFSGSSGSGSGGHEQHGGGRGRALTASAAARPLSSRRGLLPHEILSKFRSTSLNQGTHSLRDPRSDDEPSDPRHPSSMSNVREANIRAQQLGGATPGTARAGGGTVRDGAGGAGGGAAGAAAGEMQRDPDPPTSTTSPFEKRGRVRRSNTFSIGMRFTTTRAALGRLQGMLTRTSSRERT